MYYAVRGKEASLDSRYKSVRVCKYAVISFLGPIYRTWIFWCCNCFCRQLSPNILPDCTQEDLPGGAWDRLQFLTGHSYQISL